MPYRKYHNTKIDTEYGRFDSKKELKRWEHLKQLEADGQIQDLMRQVPFELVPHHRDADGRVIERAVMYYADFTYMVDGVLIVEDAKGVKTPEYVIKRKLMLDRLGIRIKEV